LGVEGCNGTSRGGARAKETGFKRCGTRISLTCRKKTNAKRPRIGSRAEVTRLKSKRSITL